MNEQQKLWSGDFGDEYHKRNAEANRIYFWYEALCGIYDRTASVLEVGAGKGDNLASIKEWNQHMRVTGIDVNASACDAMERRGIVAIHSAFPNTQIDNRYDLVLTRGFLIHVPTALLPATLEKIYQLSNRYICFAEYYSPNRRRVSYRGHRNAMWTGDFMGMLMKMHPDLRLMKYGFKYHADGGDDVTYFLVEKE